MAVGVDLSASQLRPEAVLQFIDQHTTERPQQNLLFKVDEPVFQAVHEQAFERCPGLAG